MVKPLSQYTNFSGGREESSVEQPDQRAFSRTAGTNQCYPFASLNLERDVLQGRKIPKFPGDLE